MRGPRLQTGSSGASVNTSEPWLVLSRGLQPHARAQGAAAGCVPPTLPIAPRACLHCPVAEGALASSCAQRASGLRKHKQERETAGAASAWGPSRVGCYSRLLPEEVRVRVSCCLGPKGSAMNLDM